MTSPLPRSPYGRRYGLHPSPADARDYGVARLLSRGSVPIPSSYSLEQWLGPVRDQGAEGSCTAHAGCGMLEFLFRKHDTRGLTPKFSPAYLYARERIIDGTPLTVDGGSFGRTCCKVLNQYGICLESEDPYIPGNFTDAPTPEMDAEAATMKSGAYHSIVTVDDMRHCIASDYCFIVGFNVSESFEVETGKTGVYKPKGQSLGGHEVLCYGYDDSKYGGAFLIRNSWGDSWALKGDFWFPYTAMADKNIFYDSYVSHFGKPWLPTNAVPHS